LRGRSGVGFDQLRLHFDDVDAELHQIFQQVIGARRQAAKAIRRDDGNLHTTEF
jgi:hypothetical protein